MTIKFNNVYIKNTALVAGKKEAEGPLNKYFDKTYDDYYIDGNSLEKSEVKMQKDAINILLDKEKIKSDDIDLIIGGDLSNQIATSSYAIRDYKVPFLGVFNACATSMEEIIIAGSLIDAKKIENAMCITSSHNLTAEKQFRNPIEYGAPKPLTATTTSTGAAAILLTNKKTDIKITYATIGKIVDLKINDVNNMGAAMAPAAADTIYRHLTNRKESISDYDLILTGDLGKYGSQILKDYMKEEYKISLNKNYNDCGVILYDMKKDKEITAGGSGPVCSCLVNYGYIYHMMLKNNLKKVLLVTTGALFSPTYIYQKETIPSIAHAVCIERITE